MSREYYSGNDSAIQEEDEREYFAGNDIAVQETQAVGAADPEGGLIGGKLLTGGLLIGGVLVR